MLTIYGRYNVSWPSAVSELTEVDALPCAEVQPSVCYWNIDADAKQGTFGMCRHIVQSFKSVVIVWFSLLD